MTPTTFSLHGAAMELGCSRETLRRQLTAAGFDHGGPFSLKEICAARTTDDKSAKVRLLEAQAEKIEMENARERGETVVLADVEAIITQKLVLPLRQALTGLPSTLDVRCNSEHPETARLALKQWSDETLRLCRENLNA